MARLRGVGGGNLREQGLCTGIPAIHHAGQVYVSTQRIFVHSDLLADFVERFTARVKSLRVGDPLLPETEVGPLINPREADRVESWIDEAASAGARVNHHRVMSIAWNTIFCAITWSPDR
jgi:acyl-CoA reductase-like NAD-dependent aldehyde dehydrogenase